MQLNTACLSSSPVSGLALLVGLLLVLPAGSAPGLLLQRSWNKYMCFIVFWGPSVVPLDAYRKVMQFGGVILARALMGSRFVIFAPPRSSATFCRYLQ